MANGKALGVTAAGALFLYAGIKGISITGAIQDIVTGKSPAAAVANQWNVTSGVGTGNPSATPVVATISGGTPAGQTIASTALAHVGHAYKWGGSPGPNGSGGWDCSSFVNFVLGVELHMQIPGGAYNPNTHGPVAASYISWPGASTIPRNQVAAGDLCCWSTHIGIAISNTQMVSALNPSLGTEVTGIESGGPSGETLTCRRII